LREDQKEKIDTMKNAYLSDKEFIQAWNDIINNSNKKSSYDPELIS
jgi:hypothetical protein